MNIRRTLLFSSLAVAGVAGAAFALFGQQSAPPAAAAASQQVPDAPQATPEATTVPNGPFVVMDTSMGRITCQFYQKQAPKAVANFIGLAEGTKDWTDPTTKKVEHHKPYYDGTIFHRVIPQFMIQGGDPTGTGMGDPGYTFDDEFDPGLNFDRPGRLAMANSGPNTNGSQFFITEQATDFLDQHYTLFGQCDDASVSVVKAIARVERDSNDRPREQVVLKHVMIVDSLDQLTTPPQPPPPTTGATETPGPGAAPLPKRVNISAGVAAGLIDDRVVPVYPIDAKKAGVSGTVVISAILGRDGLVKDLQIVSGPDLLRQAALDAVKQWRYKPYLLNGEPVEVRTTINIIFALGG
jgi:peptidyl-prolyl cis-trans isomerase A (cyclophilin A)